MDFAKSLVVFVCLVNFLEGVPANYSLEACWPDKLDIQFPYHTYAPVNIDTSKVRPYYSHKPLHFTIGISDKQILKNTGSGVLAYSGQPITRGTVTGGVLGNEVYIYYQIQYYWNNDASGIAKGLLDEEGAPIQAVVVYYNQKYGSFANSLHHRDGLVVVAVNVAVEGTIPNPLFTPFEEALKKIIVAGSTTDCASGATISFFLDVVPFAGFYYAYPGSYTVPDGSNTLIESATTIVLPLSREGYISYGQFEAFQNLRNAASSPINAVSSAHPTGCRPVVESTGLTHTLFP